MLQSFLYAFAGYAFCAVYALTLIYCSVYLAVVQIFHLPDPVAEFGSWLRLKIVEEAGRDDVR